MSQQLSAVHRAMNAWNEHDLDTYLKLYAADVTVSGYAPEPIGLEGMRQFYEALFAAFPDIRLERLDELVDGRKVAIRYRASGTHRGDFQGVPASGRAVSVEGMTILRFDGDRAVVERANLFDQLGMLAQIGALPATDGAGPSAASRSETP